VSDLVFNLDPRALTAAALGDGRDLNVVSGRPCRGRQGRPEFELLVLIERGLWQAAVHCCVRNRRDLAKHLVTGTHLCVRQGNNKLDKIVRLCDRDRGRRGRRGRGRRWRWRARRRGGRL
jgi:hypothetical protein